MVFVRISWNSLSGKWNIEMMAVAHRFAPYGISKLGVFIAPGKLQTWYKCQPWAMTSFTTDRNGNMRTNSGW